MYGQVLILMCFVCLFAKQRTTFKRRDTISVFSVLQGSAETKQRTAFKRKDTISVFSVLQGSAETLIRGGGKIYHLLSACCLQNISTKIIKIQQRLLELQQKMYVGVFFETQCMSNKTTTVTS